VAVLGNAGLWAKPSCGGFQLQRSLGWGYYAASGQEEEEEGSGSSSSSSASSRLQAEAEEAELLEFCGPAGRMRPAESSKCSDMSAELMTRDL
jgi:hypothetical protein